jgi:hypothetical protein
MRKNYRITNINNNIFYVTIQKSLKYMLKEQSLIGSKKYQATGTRCFERHKNRFYNTCNRSMEPQHARVMITSVCGIYILKASGNLKIERIFLYLQQF